MAYIRHGMRTSTQEHPRAVRTAANSSAAADQKVLDSLRPENRELVLRCMANHPGLSAAKALDMLTAFGM
jgi:hypothetical protein